jgi:hypothetical protein
MRISEFNSSIKMNSLLFEGQWQGFFRYGAEYGTIVEGNEVEFRLFIENYKDGEFSGRIIDWDGFGADGEVSLVNGFIDGEQISFTKKYEENYTLDEWGNCAVDQNQVGHTVIYQGHFEKVKNCFIGEWEIVYDLEHTPNLTIQEIYSGSWRMNRHE